jgi:hypothetical protein
VTQGYLRKDYFRKVILEKWLFWSAFRIGFPCQTLRLQALAILVKGLLRLRVIGHWSGFVIAGCLESIVGFPQAAGIRFVPDHETSKSFCIQEFLYPRIFAALCKIVGAHELSAHARAQLPLC